MKATVDMDRLRVEREAAFDALRKIAELSDDVRIDLLCARALSGRKPKDTERLDAIERELADVEMTCGGVWRVSCVEGDFEAGELRDAIDKMSAAVDACEGQEVPR